jgi:ABC-type dipeptide/oligopeptide/nickel transport system permease subunit
MNTELASKKPLESFYALIWRRYKKHRLAMISLIVLSVLGLLSLCAPLLQKLLGVSPQVANLHEINLPYSWPHLLGTNELGQDIFLRLIYGGRISLSVGLIAALASSMLGTFVGLLAGFYGGLIDSALMRFTDAMLSIPVLPLMIVFAAIDLNQLSFIPNGMNAWYLALGIFAVYLMLRLLLDGRKKWQRSHYISKLIIDALMLTAILSALYIVIAHVFPWQSLQTGNAASIFTA